jgi:hypothetical protein
MGQNAAARGIVHADRLRAVGGLLALIAVLVVVHRIDAPELTPPSLSPVGWSDWLDDRTPVTAVIGLARMAVIGAGWYLAAASSVVVLARSVRGLGSARLPGGLISRASESAVRVVVGATVAGAIATSPAALALPRGPAGPMVASGAPATEPVVGQQTATHAAVADPASWHPVLGAPAADRMTDGALGVIEPAGSAPPASRTAADPAEHVVRAGESFWSISADVVRASLEGPATEAEIAAHWRRFVAMNADRLVRPGDPDLIVPGQHLILPAEEAS